MTERKACVLLVEDSPTQSARLRRFFEQDNLDVLEAGSAELALDQLESRRPDLIVLDYHLPGMSGSDFCREIRMNATTRAIPVLMLTSEEGDVAQMKGLESGVDDYVVKSADPDILRVRVRALLRKAETNTALPESESRFSRVRILAIDDSATYLQRIKQEFQKEHYLIDTVQTPDEGLAKLKGVAYDCVLVDFEMPDLNGDEVCRRIRETNGNPNPEIVLIMLSSHDDKDRMTRSFEAGADDYIAKSSDFSVIRSRIRALVRRKLLVDENRRIFQEIQQRELEVLRERADKEAAEVRALMADQLAAANLKLDRANKELEHFASSAAHDLREPLRMVSIYSELLQKKYRGKLDAAGEEYIAFCMAGARRMDRLIQDLIGYARAANNAVDEAADAIDLNVSMEGALANLKSVIDETGAQIDRGSLPVLNVEAIRIQQLFQNLIGNAIKYRREEEAPRIRISAEREEDHWHFAIADNGVGISPEYRERVFVMFERLDRANSGSGLGLAICKRIVESLGGRIWVESEPGVGSIFRFTLPA